MTTETLPRTTYKAIHRQVLVVCRERIEGAFCVYVTPVPGLFHDKEAENWREDGAKLTEATARHFFPEHKDIPYAS